MNELKKSSYKYRGTSCLNCQHPLDKSDKFCPQCSQLNSSKRHTVLDFIEEFFATLFAYDSKLRKTLSAMILKPGKITRDYLDGKRTTYTNPFRFFLSLTIVYFLLLSLSEDFSTLNRYGNSQENAFNFNDETIEQLSSQVPEEQRGGIVVIDSILNSKERKIAQAKRDSIMLSQPKEYFLKVDSLPFWDRIGKKTNYYTKSIPKNPYDSYEETHKKIDVPMNINNKIAFNVSRSLYRIQSQPGNYINYIISKLPFIIFFFLPIFSFFIWLMYNMKQYYYMDHLIFNFHTLSMLILMLILGLFIDLIFKWSVSLWILFIFLIYLYKAMRKFYGQGRVKTIVKFSILNTIFFILAFTTASFLFILSILFY